MMARQPFQCPADHRTVRRNPDPAEGRANDIPTYGVDRTQDLTLVRAGSSIELSRAGWVCPRSRGYLTAARWRVGWSCPAPYRVRRDPDLDPRHGTPTRNRSTLTARAKDILTKIERARTALRDSKANSVTGD